jgi:RNA polymerase sigma-70 factor (ECF subfamily)
VGEDEFLAKRFEKHRTRLRTVAYRMLGSRSEADDAVQQAWLRLSRSDTAEVGNLGGWLTTVVGRVCLDMLRSRESKREEPLGEPPGEGASDPARGREEATDPEQEALLADSVGLALLVVLETLSPAERLAFVLHDTFAVPFEEIAPIVGRSPDAARQLASRARRRVRGTATVPETDLVRRREAAEAFLAAARGGDFEALLSVLDPDVVLRADYNAAPAIGGHEVHGAQAVAGEALAFSRLADPSRVVRPVLVNGAVGRVVFRHGKPFSVVCLAVAGRKIVAIDILADPERLRRRDPSVACGLRPAPRTHGMRHRRVRHRLVTQRSSSWSMAKPRRQTGTPISGARRA